MNQIKTTMLSFILISLVIASVECQVKQKDLSIRFGRLSGLSGLSGLTGLSFWPFNTFSPALSRQIYDMLDIFTDVAMVTFFGLPLLGLVALGASMMAPSPISSSSSGRSRRSSDGILDRSKRAILYARNLFDILANLEETFKKYEIMESECQLKAVCQVHKKSSVADHKQRSFGDQITNLIKMEKELEEYEIIPLAKIIFGQYSDAATYGNEDNDCDMIYSRCSHNLNDWLNQSRKPPKED